MTQKRISLLIPSMTVAEMESFIDGVVIRNRTQLIQMAVNEWMDRNRQKGKQLDITEQKRYKNRNKKQCN